MSGARILKCRRLASRRCFLFDFFVVYGVLLSALLFYFIFFPNLHSSFSRFLCTLSLSARCRVAIPNVLYKLLILTDQNTFMLNRSLSDAMRKRTYTTAGVRVIHISHICLSQAPGASEIFDHHLIDTGERSFYF